MGTARSWSSAVYFYKSSQNRWTTDSSPPVLTTTAFSQTSRRRISYRWIRPQVWLSCCPELRLEYCSISLKEAHLLQVLFQVNSTSPESTMWPTQSPRYACRIYRDKNGSNKMFHGPSWAQQLCYQANPSDSKTCCWESVMKCVKHNNFFENVILIMLLVIPLWY